MAQSKPQAVAVSEELQRIAKVLEGELAAAGAPGVGFSLFVFTEGRVNYISNSRDRAEIKRALRSILDGWDDGMPDVPAHRVQ